MFNDYKLQRSLEEAAFLWEANNFQLDVAKKLCCPVTPEEHSAIYNLYSLQVNFKTDSALKKLLVFLNSFFLIDIVKSS